MSVLYLLIPISLVVALLFLAGFIWAVRSGQYEDTCTPAMRILTDDEFSAPTGADAPHAPKPSPSDRIDHERRNV